MGPALGLVLELLLDLVHDLAVLRHRQLEAVPPPPGRCRPRLQLEFAAAERAHMHEVLRLLEPLERQVVLGGEADAVEPADLQEVLPFVVAGRPAKVLLRSCRVDDAVLERFSRC